jgi:hypothetical protein
MKQTHNDYKFHYIQKQREVNEYKNKCNEIAQNKNVMEMEYENKLNKIKDQI